MAEISEYVRIKNKYLLDNPDCIVCGLSGADSIHHRKGKVGYADEWARKNNISLLIDKRFFASIHTFVSNPRLGMSCHHYIEDNEEFSKKHDFKVVRSN